MALANIAKFWIGLMWPLLLTQISMKKWSNKFHTHDRHLLVLKPYSYVLYLWNSNDGNVFHKSAWILLVCPLNGSHSFRWLSGICRFSSQRSSLPAPIVSVQKQNITNIILCCQLTLQELYWLHTDCWLKAISYSYEMNANTAKLHINFAIKLPIKGGATLNFYCSNLQTSRHIADP